MERRAGWWYEKCPGPDEIAELLKYKRKLAQEVFQLVVDHSGARRLYTDLRRLEAEATKMFGKLQTIEETEEPPQQAFKAIITSVPGLIACLHKHYYERGELKNEILTIEGPGGIGKTSFVYYLVKMVGGKLLSSEHEVVEELERLIERGEWVPVLVLDDLASIISKYWFLDRSERGWAYFFRVIEYAKDWSGLIIATARSFEGVAKRIREVSTFKGTYKRAIVGGKYVIDYIEWRYVGHGRIPYYVDILWPGLRMPEYEWRNVMGRRRQRALMLIRKLREALEEARGEEVAEE